MAIPLRIKPIIEINISGTARNKSVLAQFEEVKESEKTKVWAPITVWNILRLDVVIWRNESVGKEYAINKQ